MCKCPLAPYLHEHGTDKKPSFGIKIEPSGYSGYHCFSCGEQGTFSGLAKKLGVLEGNPFEYIDVYNFAVMSETPESFDDWEEEWEEEKEEWQKTIRKEDYFPIYPLAFTSKKAKQYLLSRGVDKNSAKVMNLRYDSEEERIMFPIYRFDKGLLGFAGRSILSNDILARYNIPKTKNFCGIKTEYSLLGEHLITPNKPILVVEGLFAYAHMISLGVRDFCNPVATLGSHMSKIQRDIIVSHNQPVYLLYDDDFAGSKGLYGAWDAKNNTHKGGGAIDMLKEHVLTYVCLYPRRTNDPDDLTLVEVKKMLKNWNELC